MGVYVLTEISKIKITIWGLKKLNSPSLMEKKLFKTIRRITISNYSHYSPMLNWWTIGGTIGRNYSNK